MGLAIGMEEPAVFEQAWRAGMLKRGARPEDAHLLVNLLICDSVVIGDTAARREAQFLEDFSWLAKREILATAQAACQVTDNIGIRARVARWIHRLPNMNDAPFRIGGDALLFLLQAAG